ncbi:MAG: Hsp20/alpha crystallin family protein [Nitrospiraceae bacterium]|nr:Hsp20/alpha crystallin family protein [Nitrospiraceae bacterium]
MFWTDIEEVGRMFEPLRELERMSRSLAMLSTPMGVEFPPVNISENAEGAVITAELPGVWPSDVEISVKGNTLTLKGSRKADELKDGEFYQRRERWNGEFNKTLELPFEINADKVAARYSRGVLTVAAPRAESEKPRKITISSE